MQLISSGRVASLIIAHPGHEGLVYGWLEACKPLVHVLCDGSGGVASDRRSYTRKILRSAGAEAGPVFGPLTDRDWYTAILRGDADLFCDVARRIADACAACRPDVIVCDPLEFYNPMHDLANCIGHFAADHLARLHGTRPDVLSYDISSRRPPSSAAHTIPISNDVQACKLRLIAEFTPLASEAMEFRDTLAHTEEYLYAEDGGYAWPDRVGFEPYYERFGRNRLSEGRYSDLITYRDHVRPLAHAIRRHRPRVGRAETRIRHG